jgi:hypothetical protein
MLPIAADTLVPLPVVAHTLVTALSEIAVVHNVHDIALATAASLIKHFTEHAHKPVVGHPSSVHLTFACLAGEKPALHVIDK